MLLRRRRQRLLDGRFIYLTIFEEPSVRQEFILQGFSLSLAEPASLSCILWICAVIGRGETGSAAGMTTVAFDLKASVSGYLGQSTATSATDCTFFARHRTHARQMGFARRTRLELFVSAPSDPRLSRASRSWSRRSSLSSSIASEV